jgi:hypothetical protein
VIKQVHDVLRRIGVIIGEAYLREDDALEQVNWCFVCGGVGDFLQPAVHQRFKEKEKRIVPARKIVMESAGGDPGLF